jgi:uncharacterized protein YlxW (UPF0749 family)
MTEEMESEAVQMCNLGEAVGIELQRELAKERKQRAQESEQHAQEIAKEREKSEQHAQEIERLKKIIADLQAEKKTDNQ